MQEISMSCKILLVEDNLIAQRIGSFIINSFNDEVIIAATGAEAIKLAQEQLFDLIILDIGLPDIDGITIKETLRGTSNSTPIVGLTAYNDMTDETILAKPLTRELYQNMLSRAQNSA